MDEHRNIDSLLVDASTCITIGDPSEPIDWSGIPKNNDNVSLNTKDDQTIVVEVLSTADNQIFQGKVVHGYYPKTKEDWLDVGALVEFSLKKIAGIHKNIKRDFEDFLSQKEKEAKATPQINWETEKREWLEYLDNLYKIFQEALKEYVSKGIVEISSDEIEITEEYIGTYKAPRMLICLAGEIIRLKPIGTNLIGAKGRVDISGPIGSATVVLVDSRMKGMRDHIKVKVYASGETPNEEQRDTTPIKWEWRFVTAPPTRKYQAVNQDTIYSVIMELTNGK